MYCTFRVRRNGYGYKTLKWKKVILHKIYNLNYNKKNYINEKYSILQKLIY